jgi:hypothetical protein
LPTVLETGEARPVVEVVDLAPSMVRATGSRELPPHFAVETCLQ